MQHTCNACMLKSYVMRCLETFLLFKYKMLKDKNTNLLYASLLQQNHTIESLMFKTFFQNSLVTIKYLLETIPRQIGHCTSLRISANFTMTNLQENTKTKNISILYYQLSAERFSIVCLSCASSFFLRYNIFMNRITDHE